MKKFGLRHKFALAFIAVTLAALGGNVLWNVFNEEQRMITELDEKAAILNEQMMSVWDFISINQDLINYDSEGNYEFKRLHCSLVGLSIGKLFSQRTDYTIRYASPTPRNPFNKADAYEYDAYISFQDNSTLDHVSSVTTFESKKVFWFVAPMRIDEACLSCHGGNAGEVDILDYPKEAMKIGDLYGTVSIIMPVELYQANTQNAIIQQVIFAILALCAVALLTYLLIAHWITKPIIRLRHATSRIAQGDWDTEIDTRISQDEMGDLARDFKLMTEQLKTAYCDLEDQVENRTEALSKVNALLEKQSHELKRINDQLVEENLYKSGFLSTITHEFRTPLTAIIAFVAQLQQVDTLHSERTDRLLKELSNSSQILLKRINNVLDTARLDAGKVELSIETVDIGDIVAATEHVIRPLADSYGLIFETYIEPTVPLIETDGEKLRSILDNLVSNALKFTERGGHISVDIHFDTEKERLCIAVADSGTGISAKDHKLVFERFAQSKSSSTQKQSGSGLGLSLVKDYIELLGGDVSLTSEVGQGSTFVVTLPREWHDKKTKESRQPNDSKKGSVDSLQ